MVLFSTYPHKITRSTNSDSKIIRKEEKELDLNHLLKFKVAWMITKSFMFHLKIFSLSGGDESNGHGDPLINQALTTLESTTLSMVSMKMSCGKKDILK